MHDTTQVQETIIEKEEEVNLQLSSSVSPDGKFEILAITAGEGNGWQFSADALKESLPLWSSAQVFVDHSWFSRSIRDLAGILSSPTWDSVNAGIRCQLQPIGPSAPLIAELGHQLLVSDSHKPKVGFSADVVFTAAGKVVKKILRVNSVDLVFAPARGGAFVRALNSLADSNPLYSQMSQFLKGETMPDPTVTTPAPAPAPEPVNETLQDVNVRTEQINRKTQEYQARAEANKQAEKILIAQCGHLLTTALSASKLPAPVADRVRSQFTEKVFDPSDLDKAIEDAREMVSQLTSGSVIQGPGHVHSVFNNEDQITAAIYDLLGADRPEDLKSFKAVKLSGIRELYHLATGDYSFEGGYHPERAQFAVAADLPGILKNAMNKLIVMQWEELGRAGYRWWESIVDIQHFTSLHDITGILVGELNLLPTVNESAAYTELGVADSAETAAFTKYGGYVGITLEMFEKDDTHKLVQYPKKLASSAIRRLSNLVASIFTSSTGTGPTMADGHHVFDAANHFNLGTAALASDTWEAACKAVYNQDMIVKAGGTAPKLAIDPKFLLVPRDLRLTGRQILYPAFAHEANIFSENMQRGESGDVITVPEFTDASDWAAVCDPRLAPAIILAERFGVMPELFIADNALNGALFTNDEIRMKARLYTSVFVADHRPLYKANVA